MKLFLIASAAVTLLAMPPVLQATGTAADPYAARYSLEYYKYDPVPLTALEIRRIEKAAALYARTGTITILPQRVAPKMPVPMAAPAAVAAKCVPAGAGLAVAPLAAAAPAPIIGPSNLELRRQAKADALFKRTGIKTVLPARNVAPKVAASVVAPVAAAAGVPCAQAPVLAALSPNSAGPLAESIQSASLLRAPEVPSPYSSVPEPGTLGLLGLGLLGLGLSRRKFAKNAR
jgi:hypothetical protein